MMQPLDEQSEELFEAQAQALHLVRPPAGVRVLDATQALDQSAVDVWNDGFHVKCARKTLVRHK